MRVFVTGGTGMLGNNILRMLDREGNHTTALVRSSPDAQVFSGLGTELAYGDLLNEDFIDQQIAKSDVVVHSAGLIHLGWHRMEESMQVNRDGTIVIAEACMRNDRPLVYVGTVNTLAIGARDKASSEKTKITDANRQTPCAYVLSKRAGVDAVTDRVRRGLRASIVHPGFMLGPYDWKPSSGRMMLEVSRMWRPLAPRGGISVCDVRDVAKATIQAIDRGGHEGQQYVLAGHNILYLELWKKMAKSMGSRGPLARIGLPALTIGSLAGDAFAKLTGKEGDINSAGAKMSSMYHFHDSSTAIEQLGYQIRDLDETLGDAAEWLKQHHG